MSSAWATLPPPLLTDKDDLGLPLADALRAPLAFIDNDHRLPALFAEMPGDNEEETAIAPMDPGHVAIIEVLEHVLKDVNAEVWRTRADNRARVLRTFRSACGDYYTRRFAWFNAAVVRVAGGPFVDDEERLRAIGEELDANVGPVSRLNESIGEALLLWCPSPGSVAVEAGPQEEVAPTMTLEDEPSVIVDPQPGHEEEAALVGELKSLRLELHAVTERMAKVSASIQELLPPALPRRTSTGGPRDHWDNLYYELRRSGFEVWEIMALCHPRPEGPQTELWHKKRAALHARINRLFEKTGEQKPPQGGGIRGSLKDSYTPLSTRRILDAEDDDTA